MTAADPALLAAISDRHRDDCVTHDVLDAYVAGTASAADRQRVVGHIDGCPLCRRLVSVLAAVASDSGCVSTISGDPAHESLARPPGYAVDRYLLLHPIGQGGMGVVYEAYDPQLDRKVAIKLLRTGAQPHRRAKALAARLRREAAAMARLSHPHVVTVHDAGIDGDDLFVVMELMAETLRAHCHRGDVGWTDLIERCLEAGSGLAAAHRAGLVHCDFKPDNVLLGSDGRARVSDFGLAGVARELERACGWIGGTRRYMAPEQRTGGIVDARTDQYAFCVSVLELLAERTERAERAGRTGRTGRTGPNKTNRGRIERLQRVLSRGTETDPRDRHPSLEALLEALTGAMRRRRPAAAGVAVVAAGLMWTLAQLGAGQSPQPRPGPERPAASLPWNGWTSAAVLVRFASVSPRHGVQQWSRVRPVLDRYVADVSTQWSALPADVGGLGSSVGSETDAARWLGVDAATSLGVHARVRCLQRSHEALQTLVSALAEADTRMTAHALALARGLPPASRCAGSHAVRLLAIMPPEPDQAANVAGLQSSFARIRVALQIGRYDQVRRAIPGLLRRAQSTGHEQTIAWATLIAADMASRDADMDRAATLYADAARHATRASDPALVARSWMGWAQRINGLQATPERAKPALAAAEVALDGAGEDPELMAELEFVRANVARREQRYDDAEAHYRTSIDGLSAEIGRDAPRTVAVRLALAGLERQTNGEYDGLEALLPVVERAFGPRHPQMALLLADLAGCLRGIAPKRAQAYIERAQSIRHEVLSPEHPELAQGLHTLALLASARGDLASAKRHALEAIELGRRAFGPNSTEQTYALLELASIEEHEGQRTSAIGRLLEITERLEDQPHHEVNISAEFHLGLAFRELDPARALQHAERAAMLLREASGMQHPHAPLYLLVLAARQSAVGDDQAALRTLEEALALPVKAVTAYAHGQVLFDWARLREKLGTLDAEVVAAVHAMHERSTPDATAEFSSSVQTWLDEHGPAADAH